MIIHEALGFLGERRRQHLLNLLASPNLQWERSDVLGRTTCGRVQQLANTGMHRTPEMLQLSTVLASAIYDELTTETPATLPAAADLVPQVFPVRMDGNPDDPPAQHPHVDGEPHRPPIITTVYYADIQNTVGGQLLLYDDHSTIHTRITPSTDQLLVLRGDVLHAVDSLTSGTRTSIVTNFYNAP